MQVRFIARYQRSMQEVSISMSLRPVRILKVRLCKQKMLSHQSIECRLADGARLNLQKRAGLMSPLQSLRRRTPSQRGLTGTPGLRRTAMSPAANRLATNLRGKGPSNSDWEVRSQPTWYIVIRDVIITFTASLNYSTHPRASFRRKQP